MWATGLCQFPQGHWPKSPGLQSPDAGLPKDSGSPMTGFPDMQSRTGSFRVKKKKEISKYTREYREKNTSKSCAAAGLYQPRSSLQPVVPDPHVALEFFCIGMCFKCEAVSPNKTIVAPTSIRLLFLVDSSEF